ncbi:MAG: adenylosuccinate synthase [Desulfovibrionaceae bacterium]|nr:adenylosuccinate synthase [Desulfovibrionaceae bacterium]
MSNMVIIGAQWGDEGKGKIVDLLSAQSDYIVRFQGGNNAGHTVIVDGEEYILHLIPSGILHQGKVCLIGNGVVLDPAVFCQELDTLASKGVDVAPAYLKISRKTHLIMPYHRALDKAREKARIEGEKIGTTGRGIGPAYEDKVTRIGVRAADLEDLQLLRRKVEIALVEKNALLTSLYNCPAISADEVMAELTPLAERLVPYLADVSGVLGQARLEGKTIMFEGAQGTHLDIDHGTYPFVTSSNTVAGNAAAGSGLGPRELERIIGIVKAYTTRVGGGPFPTQLDCEIGRHLQSQGAEVGATTKRVRRCGWFDAVLVRESVRLNSLTELTLTKLDVLSGLKELKICVAYKYRGEEMQYPPQAEAALAEVEPVYETLPGWSEDITGAKSMADLPAGARAYIRRIEELVGVKAGLISVGPDRNQTFSACS